MIDLHVHTNISDGTYSPEEVVRHAQELGLRAIAVTDHDTVSGVGRAQQEGSKAGVEVVAGVEISAYWTTGILHVLGYFVPINHPDLLRSLNWLAKGRRERIPKILDKLRCFNVNITEEEVAREAIGGVPGRPHVAKVMVRKGYTATLQDGFDRYLRRGAPAYVVKTKMQPEEAVSVIAAAGGLPVLAHPHSLGEDAPASLEKLAALLSPCGLKGVEAYYSKHTIPQTQAFLEIAAKFGLAVTGGSDFHGSNKPEVKLGCIPAVGTLPYSILDNLKHISSGARSAPLSPDAGVSDREAGPSSGGSITLRAARK